MPVTALPLPEDIRQRLDIITAKPLLRRAPRVAEALAALVQDAAGRRSGVIQPALALADRHRPAVREGGAPDAECCMRCANRPRWPCREAVIAAEILHALGHAPPYGLPRSGHPGRVT